MNVVDDGFLTGPIKKFIGWLEKKNWKAILTFLIIIFLSFLFWRYFEGFADKNPYKKYLIEVSKSIFLASLVIVLFEGSRSEKRSEKLSKEFSFVSELLKNYLGRQECCRNCVHSLIELNISKIFSRRSLIEYNDINFLSSYKGPLKIVGILPSDFDDIIYSLPGKTWKLKDILVEGTNIRSGDENENKINILILAPFSSGTYLKNNSIESYNLYTKVYKSLEELTTLLSGLTPEQKKKVDIRLCHSFPISRMLLTDKFAFVQPNILHNEIYDPKKLIPLFKFEKKSDDDDEIFNDLENHFKTIWKYDSMSLDEFIHHEVGTHFALNQMKSYNIYIPRSQELEKKFDPFERMKYLINNTKEILWIKSVSARLLFHKTSNNDSNKTLYDELEEKINTIKDVRILLIDPECENAKMRSYREYILDNHQNGNDISYNNLNTSYEDFKNSEYALNNFQPPVLLSHTKTSIIRAKKLIHELEKKKKSLNDISIINESFYVRKYTSPPDSAFIITDTVALFEPLHYGMIQNNNNNDKILSGHMPMHEFQRAENADVLVPYNLIKNNFEFVFNIFSKPI